MKDLTVILPIYDKPEYIAEPAKVTIESFLEANKKHETELVVVGSKESLDVIKSLGLVGVAEYLEAPEGMEIKESTLINYAVSKLKTKYFSVLSMDDTLVDDWFDDVDEYMKSNVEASVYLPLVECYNLDKKGVGSFIGFSNEAVWASSFSEEIGYFDEQSLVDYMYFTPYGGIFTTEDYKEAGQLKESMDYLYWCELFLRMLHNKFKVFTIPKVGYRCAVSHEENNLQKYNGDVNQDEMDFWIDTTKKEYMFKKDRNKKFKGNK